MKFRSFFSLAALLLTAVISSAQKPSLVVVHDPTKQAVATKMTPAEQALFERVALPRVRRIIKEEVCSEGIDISGVAHGAFSRTGAVQSLVFYQYCQTGNGFGEAGLVLMDEGKVVGNFIADAGWTIGVERVADINWNGIDEFTLAYSGGLHQGQGGAGVDLMEFTDGKPVGFGWYKSEEYGDTQASAAWKLTAKPGPTPLFYRQKFTSRDGNKWRAVSTTTAAFKLGTTFSKFEAVK